MTVAVFQENKEKEHFLQVCDALRKRPGAFLREITLDNLESFLSGYQASFLFKDEAYDFFQSESPSFFDWIAMKEGVGNSSSFNWAEALKHSSESDFDAFEKFFSYLSSYQSRRESLLERVELSIEFINCYRQEAFTSCEEKPVVAEVISYEKNSPGVFLRFLNSEGEQIDKDRYFLNIDFAKGYLG